MNYERSGYNYNVLTLATAVTDPSFESAAASALVAELLDFAAACRLDYASSLAAESVPASPLSVGGECALGTYVLEDRQKDFECLAAAVPRFASLLLAPDAPDIPTPRSYAEAITDEVPQPGVNIVDGMWIFRVKWPLGSPPAFKARYVAQGFRQRQGVDYFHTFSSTLKMTTLRVLLHVAAQRDYELNSLDFSLAILQGSLHEEMWLRRPPGFTGSFPTGTQWSLRRPVYGLRQAPREWHDTLRTTLAALGFVPSTADPSLFLRTDTSLPPFYVLVYVDVLVFATADTEALTLVKSELQKRHTCTDLGPSALRLLVLLATAHFSVYQPLALSSTFGRVHRAEWSVPRACGLPHAPKGALGCCEEGTALPVHYIGMGLVLGGRGPDVLNGHADASWVDDSATQWSSQGYTFSLGSGSISWRSTGSSSVLSSSCEAKIYAGAISSHELRWLTYLLPSWESSLQRGQLRLAYVATRANTADVFTKALPPGDHQHFVTALLCFTSSLDLSCDHCLLWLSPTSPMGITWDRARRTIILTQSHIVHQVLQRFGFLYSSPQLTPLSTSHSLSAPPSDEFAEPSGPYPELVGCLMYLMTCTRPDLAYPLSLLARYVARGRHRKLEEQPRSPPVLYVDNKAMIALCQEHKLEHRRKHIALRYFLARELQQRGQLRLAYVATRANTADVFTKALSPGDHQRFVTVLGLVPALPH
ncbi:unnamed protein product [Closterium sp. NIES-53]